jgi:tetratricopeptide (TPR) repeat protein
MRARASWMVVPLGAIILLVGGLSWWFLWPRPTLDGVPEQIATGRYRAAEGTLREYLRAYPRDDTANLLLARLYVERPDPEPELALRLIDGLHPTDPHQAALVKATEGEAHFWANRFDEAERAWLEALRLEPTIPEVGWKILDLYALQERVEDSTRLALRLFAIEPDPRDRVQLLLQLLRPDAHPIEAGTLVHELEPVVRGNPRDLHSTLTLGIGLIASGRAEDGLGLLRRAVGLHGDDRDTWLAYLDGLAASGGVEELGEALEKMPQSLAESPQVEAAKGWLASQRRDLDEAARAYGRALEGRPFDAPLAYRYKNVRRQAGQTARFQELEPRIEASVKFPGKARDLFDRINELPDLGLHTHPELFGEAAAALAQVGRRDEAAAWEQLAQKRGPGSP